MIIGEKRGPSMNEDDGQEEEPMPARKKRKVVDSATQTNPQENINFIEYCQGRFSID
jgi:hypothetical protein